MSHRLPGSSCRSSMLPGSLSGAGSSPERGSFVQGRLGPPATLGWPAVCPPSSPSLLSGFLMFFPPPQISQDFTVVSGESLASSKWQQHFKLSHVLPWSDRNRERGPSGPTSDGSAHSPQRWCSTADCQFVTSLQGMYSPNFCLGGKAEAPTHTISTQPLSSRSMFF